VSSVPNIITGTKKGIEITDAKTEPLLRLSVNDVLMAPIKDKIIVPRKRLITKYGIIVKLISKIKHKKGDEIRTGRQVTIQNDVIFDKMPRYIGWGDNKI
tara:strand:- start:107 stop:406 length:300 start_codon:yes stop_codon:yes gene_type:complete